MAETWRGNHVTEDDLDYAYIDELASKLTLVMQGLNGEVNPSDEFTVKQTIIKVLIYINNSKLPVPLEGTVVEMSARQVAEYKDGLSSVKGEGAVKKVQRGGFSQEFETKQSNSSIPRGTQFMQDYVKYLNRFRRVRLV